MSGAVMTSTNDCLLTIAPVMHEPSVPLSWYKQLVMSRVWDKGVRCGVWHVFECERLLVTMRRVSIAPNP